MAFDGNHLCRFHFDDHNYCGFNKVFKTHK